MALILRPVIQIQHQSMWLKPRVKFRPQFLQAIHNKIGRNRAGSQKEPDISRSREQQAKQVEFGLRRKVMIDSGGRTAIIATPGIRSKANGRFGIQREAEIAIKAIR